MRAATILAINSTLLSLLCICMGCSRTQYRIEADRDAYGAIDERNHDPRWVAPDYSIEMDPRSRYFDAYDPDHPPMPADDPASHAYFHYVDGKEGWKHWHDNGERLDLENTSWRDALSQYVEVDDEGAVKLDVNSALRLAYLHSPNHQRQLESLYLSALDVTAERFRLDTQFYGGYDTRYAHNGSLIPRQLSYSPTLKRFVITPAIDGDGVENNRLTVGRPFGGNPALLAQRQLATAGELLVGFANSFVFEFTGGDANLSASLANFSFIQPLLRGAGKDIALEQLTQQERRLLANLRAYGQFRQGFYTQIAIGELGVTGPQRGGGSTSLQSFSGQGGVNGYLGLLQQRQQIRNSEDNLNLQLRTLNRLIALYNNELTDLVQVDQFRQSVEAQRSELLVRRNSLELALDNYKTRTLGLPPNLPMELDQSLISQFQLFSRESTAIQESILELQADLGELPDVPAIEELEDVLSRCNGFMGPVRQRFEYAKTELARMDDMVPQREASMSDIDKEQFRADRNRLHNRMADLVAGDLGFDVAVAKLKTLEDRLSEETREETLRGLTTWVGQFLQTVARLSLVPAQARLEVISVDPIELEAEDAFQVALNNRLDFMNGRAALVDRWRLVQVNADALQSVLNLTASGDIRTAQNNPLSFRAPTGAMRMGLEFDAPFTRLLERNAYREALINYQRSRRDLIQSRDSLHLGLRALLRNLEQLRKNLEIQRRAVAIAMRRVDQTQLLLNPPRLPLQPGARHQINQTTAINLLSAQGSLQATQNNFLAAWLNYYVTRMRLYRELGIMTLDPEGQWIEFPIDGGEAANDADAEEIALPPMVPISWQDSPGELSSLGGSQTNRAESPGLQPVELRSVPTSAVIRYASPPLE
jgi:outer membrane protein TolC